MWFLNPIKSIRYIIWHNYKWKIMKFFGILLLIFFFLFFVYAVPGNFAKLVMHVN